MATNSDRRRNINLLPEIHRTDTLKRFFGATVDTVFNPGKSVPFSGYIGQKPGYYDAQKDFYIPEPDAIRSAYQLEASMIQTDDTGDIQRALCYDDLIGYLASLGADTTQQQRMFEADAYAWSPPIDTDKLINYRFYNWFGEEGGREILPSLPLMSPFRASLGDGSNNVFSLPGTLPQARPGDETIAVFAMAPSAPGFTRYAFTVVDANTVRLTRMPVAGTLVLTIRYGDLNVFLSGRYGYDISALRNTQVYTSVIADGALTTFTLPSSPVGSAAPAVLFRTSPTDPGTIVSGWERVGEYVQVTAPPSAGTEVVVFRDERLLKIFLDGGLSRLPPVEMPRLTSGMRVRLLDQNVFENTTTEWQQQTLYYPRDRILRDGVVLEAIRINEGLVFDAKDWLAVPDRAYVDGVGRGIRIALERDMLWGFPAQHSLIERASNDGNSWSVRNHWVHRDSFAWSGLSSTTNRAKRPIIEFFRDMKVWGSPENARRVADVDAIITHGRLYAYDLDIGTQSYFSETTSYAVGDRVIYSGLTYEAIAATTGGFDSADWRLVNDRFPFSLLGELDLDEQDIGAPGGFDKNGAIPLTAANRWPLGSLFADNGYAASDDMLRSYYRLKLGDRILVTENTNGGDLRNRILTVGRQVTNGVEYAVLIPDPAALPAGSVVRVKGDLLHPNNNIYDNAHHPNDLPEYPYGREYGYNGGGWSMLPVWAPYKEPVFSLHDAEGGLLDDAGIYAASNFADTRAGKIFTFARSETAPKDAVIGFAVQRDKRNDVMFESSITQRVSYGVDSQIISGLYFWKRAGVLETVWHRQSQPLRQPIEIMGLSNPPALSRGDSFRIGLNSEYCVLIEFDQPENENRELDAVVAWVNEKLSVLNSEWVASKENSAFVVRTVSRDVIFIENVVGTPLTTLGLREGVTTIPKLPLNLQANPTNDEPTLVTRGEIFEHQASIIQANIGLDGGQAFAGNRYRDTGKDWTVGTKIMQHRSPMLRLMLTASDSAFDVAESIRYVEREHMRFRAKLLTRANDLRNRGVIHDTQAASDRVRIVLDALRSEKGSDFPFFYNTLGGARWFIPPTPASLGLLPVFTPRIVSDSMYSGSVIVGHDGSRTPASGDWKDDLLLAYEQLVYLSLPAKFKDTERPAFDLDQWLHNAWHVRQDGYDHVEYSRAYAVVFERWAQGYALDYKTNTTYEDGNPFSWNYRGRSDWLGRSLPGSWRAIYRWYFGTERPHETPWEMLGFSNKPSWWDGQYGAAPYRRGNTTLWNDLRDGVIRQGERAGTDEAYARRELLSVLPIDDAGNLLDPLACGIVPQAPSYQQASSAWVIGDMGPVEALWASTPSYGFGKIYAGLLLKPARQIEFGWDTLDTGFVGDQWLQLSTNERPQPKNDFVNGETVDGAIKTVFGIQQWVVDRLISLGQSPATLGNAMRAVSVRLAHKVAAFTSRNDLRAVADDFGLVPSEDISLMLYRSPVARNEVYSGVIVEWTGRGWQVIGYDARDPFFTIMPGDPNGPRDTIGLSDVAEPVVVQWRPNTFYSANTLVTYEYSTYRAIRSHTSGPAFEMMYWTAAPGVDQANPRVFRYLRGDGSVERVSYGTLLFSRQEVADFLFGYERWLISRGWRFEVSNENGSQIRDWSLVCREYLNWTMLNWAPGNFISLSPGAEELHFGADNGLVLNVEQSAGGFYGLLDRQAQPIPEQKSVVSRLDGDVKIKAFGADIYCARLGVSEVEHMLIFSNKTIFSDNIYAPLFNLRQPRLKVMGRKTSDWAGRPSAKGFVLYGDQLLPSYDKAAEDVRLMFGIEEPDNALLRSYARHLTGFETRSYLDNLLISQTGQFEFHQGLIQAKGSPGSLDRLLRSRRLTGNRSIAFLEEWAIRAAKFGTPAGDSVEFLIRDSDFRQAQQFIRMVPTPGAPVMWIGLEADDQRWIEKPRSTNFFKSIRLDDPLPFPEALPTAGWVRLSDVTYTTLSDDTLTTLFNTVVAGGTAFQTGDRIWSYGAVNRWQVWRLSNTNQVQQVITVGDDLSITAGCRLIMRYSHGMQSNDVGSYIMIHDADNAISGVWVVRAVNVADNWIEIDAVLDAGVDYSDDLSSAPVMYRLRPTRFATINDYSAATHIPNGEIAYIDNGDNWFVVQVGGGVVRQRPLRVDPARIAITSAHDLDTRLTKRQAISEPSLVNRLSVIDPVAGYLPGVADRELSFKVDFDPARYTADGTNDAWGEEQVGMLWWDTSTVRFLDPFTDRIGMSNERDLSELTHRIGAWAQVAPGCSVDVYEWVGTDVSPESYLADTSREGVPAAGSATPYITRSSYDPSIDKLANRYFFWVKNLSQVPARQDRKLSSTAVADILRNPTTADVPWIAAISGDGMLVSGLTNLNDVSTVLRVGLVPNASKRVQGEWQPNGVAHDEWFLLREHDERSLPPASLWTKLRDSLVGFSNAWDSVENRFSRLPHAPIGTPPEIVAVRYVGIDEGQSMFDPGIRDTGRRAARRSYVDMVNTIFARAPLVIERQSAVDRLDQSDELEEYLMWVRPDGTKRLELPPKDWTYQVFDNSALQGLLPYVGASDRVLLNRLSADLPQWSIWQKVNGSFVPARAYEQRVTTMSQRDQLTGLAVGDRVAVETDFAWNGFWTIWRWNGATFDLHRSQRYRTSDLYALTDWYADGYSATTPPVVVFANATDRDTSEGDTPSVSLVRLNDDGFGRWCWTAWDGSAWNIVARENGTVALSSAFHLPGRSVHAVTDASASGVVTRDGTWELQVLFDVLLGEVLTDAEKNELFFSMLHFAHSQQDVVDWAFKTSFLSVSGYDEALRRTPIAEGDPTTDLLAYIEEVKPYRVKVRDILRRYETEVQNITGRMTDFDKAPYVGTSVRILDEQIDGSILGDRGGPRRAFSEAMRALGWDASTWSGIVGSERDWYDTPTPYLSPANSPIRRMKVTMLFDRVAVDESEVPDTAINRIAASYAPIIGMKPKDARLLLGLNFKGPTYDGSSDPDVVLDDSLTPDVLVNPDVDGRPGLQGRDPYLDPNHPPERIAIYGDDSTMLRVHSRATAGEAPMTQALVHAVGPTTVVIDHKYIAESNHAVMLWKDGQRVSATDYQCDPFAAKISYSLSAGPAELLAHAVHLGGPGVIKDRYLLRWYTGRSLAYTLEPSNRVVDDEDTIEVTINGVRSTAFSVYEQVVNDEVVSRVVTLDNAPANNADICIVVRGAGGGERIWTDEIALNDGNSFSAALPHAPNTVIPQHAATIVELDGYRLRPPPTFYGKFGAFADRDTAIEMDRGYPAYVSGNPMPPALTVYVRRTGSQAWIEASANIIPDVENGQWLAHDLASAIRARSSGYGIWRNYVISFESADSLADVIVVNNDPAERDYVVANGQLSLVNEDCRARVRAGAKIMATAMRDDATGVRTQYPQPHIQTYQHMGRADGSYVMPSPRTNDYAWVCVGGAEFKRVAGDGEFTFGDAAIPDGFDSAEFDDYGFGSEGYRQGIPWRSSLNMAQQQGLVDRVITTLFLGKVAREAAAWQSNTILPAHERSLVQLGPDEFGLNWEHVRMRYPAKLAQDVVETSSEIRVLVDTSEDIPFDFRRLPLTKPEGGPGVVWIEGERIEYHTLAVDQGVMILGDLRRKTRGTTIMDQHRHVVHTAGDGSRTSFNIGFVGALEVSVRVKAGDNYVRGSMGSYTITVGSGVTTVVFDEAPAAGEWVTLVVTVATETKYPAGTVIYDGCDTFAQSPIDVWVPDDPNRVSRHADGYREALFP